MLDTDWFKGKKATVMGLGLFGGGAAVSRFLFGLGARVTVTDLRGEDVLAPSIEALGKTGIRFVLGRHDEGDFAGADVVVKNPAVPPSSPYIEIARKGGARIESEMNLFFQACPSSMIVGVTGSNGKSTTTALLGAMLSRAGFTTRVGGNIGRPLIEEALSMHAQDRVVLELSSFQLEDLDRIEAGPAVGVLTNITPNHLDRHGTMEAYVRAKATMFRHQSPDDVAVINGDDELCRAMAQYLKSTVVFFSTTNILPEGFFLDGDVLASRIDGTREDLFTTEDLKIPGRFNVGNALAAAAAASAAGASPEALREGVRSFEGIPHRLERVAERLGATWFNDSIATTPESTMAALGAFDGGIVLIAGGYDKKLDYEAMCRTAAVRARAMVLLGATAETIRRGVKKVGGGPEIAMAASLEEAVQIAASFCREGDTVLLSPGAASYDMFLNFEERGERFRELVLALPE